MEAFSNLVSVVKQLCLGAVVAGIIGGNRNISNHTFRLLQLSQLPYALKLAFFPSQQDRKSAGTFPIFRP